MKMHCQLLYVSAPHLHTYLPVQKVRPEERAAVEAAMQAAFIEGTPEAWELLLELTGAAAQADGRDGAPCVNIQHRATGELHGCCLSETIRQGRGADVGCD